MFSDPKVQALWDAGKIRAAYEASSAPGPATSDHPFRDPTDRLAAARRAYEHGTLCWYAAQFAESHAVLERARTELTSLVGAEHPDTLDASERLAAIAHYRLEPDAPKRFSELVAKLEAVHGADSVRVAIARRNSAACLRDMGDFDGARALVERAREVLFRALPDAHAETVALLKVSSLLHHYELHNREALDEAKRAVELGTRVWGVEHPFVAHAELTVATAELELDKVRAATKRMPSIIHRIERGMGDHPMLGLALAKYAECEIEAASNFLRAQELARRAIEVYGQTYAGVAENLVWILFRSLYEGGLILEAGDLALELGDTISRRLAAEMSLRIANALVQTREERVAVFWLQRTSDLCDDPEVAAAWANQAELFRRRID